MLDRIDNVSQKLEIELPYDPTITLLDKYLNKMQSVSQRDICILMFIVALFTTAKIWKQPQCLSMDKWIKCGLYKHTRILLSHKRKSCHR